MEEIKKKILFVCNVNRLRSPTAYELYKNNVNIEVRSAGVSNLAKVQIDDDLFNWADIIFIMDNEIRKKLRKKYYKEFNTKRILCLNVPDEYDYMDPELIQILTMKLSPIIGIPQNI